uniref:Chemokine interleukin-8-like domain-containing protein n=1 Tax=Gopherus agassizii TaxID=38772 RepID=A0A452I221_9SAUR
PHACSYGLSVTLVLLLIACTPKPLSDAPHFPSLTESLLGGELRCQCLQTVSGLVSPKLLVHVEIIPKGPQCSTVESGEEKTEKEHNSFQVHKRLLQGGGRKNVVLNL